MYGHSRHAGHLSHPSPAHRRAARVQNRGMNLGALLRRDQEWKFQRGSSRRDRYATRDYVYKGMCHFTSTGGRTSFGLHWTTDQLSAVRGADDLRPRSKRPCGGLAPKGRSLPPYQVAAHIYARRHRSWNVGRAHITGVRENAAQTLALHGG